MSTQRSIPGALLVGATLGAIVLGLLGRLATAGVALATGFETNLSLGGLLEALLVGGGVGAVGGLLSLPLRGIAPRRAWIRGVVLGAVLFAASLAASWLTHRLAPDQGAVQMFTLTVVAAAFAGFGICFEELLSRFE